MDQRPLPGSQNQNQLKDPTGPKSLDNYRLFTATLSTQWSITWRANNGQTGAPSSYTTSASQRMKIQEIQALVTYNN